MWGNWGAGGWLWPLGALLMIVFWGLIIAGVVLLVRWLWTAGQSSAPRGEPALDILKKRYARGEITKAEFDERKRDLQ
ncbi:MAG: SHOCT domain-containing protein [Chloroflexi bacterium]|nr:SHOCT domain-containing protein [Chloroflexota bacterium]